MKVTVTRAFLLGGKRHEVGTSVEVPDGVGRELVASGKAERAQAALLQPGPLTTETAAAVVKGKAAKDTP